MFKTHPGRIKLFGIDYLDAATRLLQDTRQTHSHAGVWEAADLQWWWRTPRSTDTMPQAFWTGADG